MRTLLFVLVAMTLLVGVGVVSAQDELIGVETEDYGHVHIFGDHRLNAFDMDAPVAIYYSTTTVAPYLGAVENRTAPSGIEVWAFDPRTDTSQKVLNLSFTEIARLIRDADEDLPLVENSGYSLNYSTDGFYWVTAPNYRGSTYTFTWEG